MTTNSQLDIIGYLLNQEEPQTMRGIARALEKSYPLVYNAIQDLLKKEIIVQRSAPPAKIIGLNAHATSEILIESEKKRSFGFLQKNKAFQIFLEDVLRSAKTAYFSLLVFGGYAKGTETPKSDLDLLIIVPTKADIQEMEELMGEIHTSIKKHVIIVDEVDFIGMLSRANQFNVGNEARKHHLILYGVEQYYELVRRARQ